MIPSSFTRKFLIVLAVLACIGYLAYRVNWTFNTSGPYAYTASLLLLVAECFGILNLFLFFLQVWDVREPPARPVLEGRTVDVFVPTLDEDVALLRTTLEACVRMDYPHRTYVLDDGRRPEVEELARELGVRYLCRPDNRNSKAGNLNHALGLTDGEFVVVLDADHVPEPQFITRLIGYFADDRLGYVQTPHAFYNFDSFQARLDHANRKYWEEGDLFHRVIQPGRNRWDCPAFAGSAAMFRRSAIMEVGLMATDTAAAGVHTGLRMNTRGWRSLAVSERLVAGQAAPDITTFHTQRLRRGTGHLSILCSDNPLTTPGLRVAQRLCYLGSILPWAAGPFKLIIYLTPIAMLFSGIPPVKAFTGELLWVTAAYLVVSLTAFKLVSKGYGSIINAELFSMVNFWTQTKATARAVLGYGTGQYHVTLTGAAGVRGRRQRSIWPYIRPQTYLIILTVLALVWAWSKPVLELSDDWFRPVIPTVWALFHFWLACKVTQRAFWPADRRLTTRHLVHVPVEYDTVPAGSHCRYGVTIDLSDQGMAFVAYEKFSPGDVLRLTIRGAGEVVKCKGEVRTVTDLTRGQVADGFRYGVQFSNLSAPQADALNRICLRYGVPRLYGEYDRRRGGLLGTLRRRLDRGLSQRRREVRSPYRMPIVVNNGLTEETAQFSVTEDLSRSAVAALLDDELPEHTAIGFLMATPIGEVRGSARVLRTAPEAYGGRTYFRTVFEFADFEGQGGATLHALVDPREAGPLEEALKPDRKPILAQMAGATVVATLIAVPLIVLQSGIFGYYHRDDYVLRDIHARAQRDRSQLTAADAGEVERIFKATMEDRYPTSDRLVLLMNALQVYEQRPGQLAMTGLLAGCDGRDQPPHQSLADSQLRAERYAEAEATCEHLKQHQKTAKRFDADRQRRMDLAGARVAEGRGDLPLAIERYRRLYARWPDHVPDEAGTVPLRREFAGVLLQAGAFDEAKRVLEPSPGDDVIAQRMRVAAHLRKGRAIAAATGDPDARRQDDEAREYDGAERVVEALARVADRKLDAALKDAAERMRSDVHTARQSWTLARQIVDKVAAVHGTSDPDLIRRLAQVQLALGDYAGARSGFATLLENDRVSGALKGDVIRGFLEAASDPTFTPGERERAIALGKVLQGGLVHIENDPVCLARLGWVLHRVGRPDESRQALERARQPQPSNPGVRDQLASILIQTGNENEAAALLAGSNPFRARQTRAAGLMRRGDWPGAAAELRTAVDEFPAGYRNPDGYAVTTDDVKRTELLLGTVLGLRALKQPGDGPDAFAPVVAHYEALQQRYPDDPGVAVRLGDVHLWSAERSADPARRRDMYATALKHFQRVLEDRPWAPDAPGAASRANAERGFIDAAASIPDLDAAQTAIATDIAARRLTGSAPEPLAAARLARVLIRTQDAEARRQGVELIRKAVGGRLADDERKELANALTGAGESKLAAEILGGAGHDVAGTIKPADDHAGAGQKGSAGKDPSATAEQKRAADRELARTIADAGQHAEALSRIADLLRQQPGDVELMVLQAEVNLRASNPDVALALFVPLLKEHPNKPRVAAGFAGAAARSRAVLTEDAKEELLKLTERATGPDNRDALLLARLAEAHATKLGAEDRARELARKAAHLDPKDPVARREVAWVLADPRIGLFKEADALVAGIELSGEERKRYVLIGSRAGNHEAARRQARRYLAEQEPGSVNEREARRLLADTLARAGDYDEAITIYERLSADRGMLRFAIGGACSHWQICAILMSWLPELLGRDAEAWTVWGGLIDAASAAPTAEHHKALVLRFYDRFAPEVRDVRALSRLARALLRLNEPAKAHAVLTRAVAANPDDPAVRKELAAVLAAADRRAEAIAMLTCPSVLPTLDGSELTNLADLLTAENQLERAEDVLAKAVTDASDRASRVRYASVLVRNGKFAMAQSLLSRLTHDFPKDREVLLLVAQSDLGSKDYPNALRRFTELVSAGRGPESEPEPLANADVWRGYVDAAAGVAGESLRDYPGRTLRTLFTSPQQDAILRAFGCLPAVREQVSDLNEEEMCRLTSAGADEHTDIEFRQNALRTRHDGRMRDLAESMGRLGMLLALLGDREKSREAFGAALRIDRQNREVWYRYAQALTALGDDLRAKAVFDWLLAKPAQKTVVPAGFEGQR